MNISQMQLILDFDTNITVEEALGELAEFIEIARIAQTLSYTELQHRAKELGCGVNVALRTKNANMTSDSLSTLATPYLLNYNFKIQTQAQTIITKSDNPKWVKMFMLHLIEQQQDSGFSRDKFSRLVGVSNYSVAKWPTAQNITLKYLFKCLKYLKYKMIFDNQAH